MAIRKLYVFVYEHEMIGCVSACIQNIQTISLINSISNYIVGYNQPFLIDSFQYQDNDLSNSQVNWLFNYNANI